MADFSGATVPSAAAGNDGDVLTLSSGMATWLPGGGGGSQIAGFQAITASGNFVVPAGVTKIKARMWGGGGGAAGGAAGDGVTNGNDGTAGTDTWVKVSANKARGGGLGTGGTAGQVPGAATPALLPVITAASFQSGSFGIDQQTQLGLPQVLFQAITTTPPYSNGGSGTNAIANAGLSGSGAYGGSDNIINFGANGNGGQNGEYAEWGISVTPGEIVPVTVGAGGTGGATSGGTNPGGTGGNGGSGFVIIEW